MIYTSILSLSKKTLGISFTFLIFCFALLVSGTTTIAQSYRITNLGTLGGVRSSAHGINLSGQVIGRSQTANGELHAFLYSNGRMIDLGTLGGKNSYAAGINDDGQVVGYSHLAGNQVQHSFLYSGGSLLDLGTLGGASSASYAINNFGEVVGLSQTQGDSDANTQIFFYANGTLTSLGTLSGVSADVTDMNNRRDILGHTYTDLHGAGGKRAFVLRGRTMPELLPTLGGSYTIAYAINDNGQVVGASLTASGAPFNGVAHAFYYERSRSRITMIDLGTLTGGTQSFAYGINNIKQIVGASDFQGTGLRAFIYEQGVMKDLNTLIPANSGWKLIAARAINDNGQIVGEGVFNNQQRAFLLTKN